MYKTAENFGVALGKDHELYTKYDLLSKQFIEKCQELGDDYLSKFRMDWDAAE